MAISKCVNIPELFVPFVPRDLRIDTYKRTGLLDRPEHRLIYIQMSIFAEYLLRIFDMLTRADTSVRHFVSKRNPRHTTKAMRVHRAIILPKP